MEPDYSKLKPVDTIPAVSPQIHSLNSKPWPILQVKPQASSKPDRLEKKPNTKKPRKEGEDSKDAHPHSHGAHDPAKPANKSKNPKSVKLKRGRARR